MTSRRGATGLSGILPVDKPAGMTSHDVVNVVRRVTGERRVGHAGTLDPMATGVLVVLVGPATRLAPYLTGQDKEYEATIEFGAETDTDDAEGTTIRSAAVPEELSNEEVARAAVVSGDTPKVAALPMDVEYNDAETDAAPPPDESDFNPYEGGASWSS